MKDIKIVLQGLGVLLILLVLTLTILMPMNKLLSKSPNYYFIIENDTLIIRDYDRLNDEFTIITDEGVRVKLKIDKDERR